MARLTTLGVGLVLVICGCGDNLGGDDGDDVDDTVAPRVTITSPLAVTSGDQIELTFTTSGEPAGIECQVDNGAFVACSSPFPLTGLTAAPHVVNVRATDAAGNIGTDTQAFVAVLQVMCLTGSDHGDGDVSGTVDDLHAATIEFWFRSHVATGDFEIIDFDVPALFPENPVVGITHFGDSFLVDVDARRNLANNGELNHRMFASPPGFTATGWHHYAIVFTGTTQRFFIDGSELTTGEQTSGSEATSFADALAGFDPISQPIVMHLGWFARDEIRYASGALVDVRVSSIARYTAPFTPTYPVSADAFTVLLFPLREGSGTTSDDDGSSAATATWTSPAWSTCF